MSRVRWTPRARMLAGWVKLAGAMLASAFAFAEVCALTTMLHGGA